MFNVEFKRYGTIVTATVHAAQVVDANSVRDFGDTIIAFLERHPDSHILLNFTKVDYMSSAMLTELLRINDVIRRQRGSMRICGLRKEMRDVLHVTKLEEMFRIEDEFKSCAKAYHKDVSEGARG